jgi:hypothetical protein
MSKRTTNEQRERVAYFSTLLCRAGNFRIWNGWRQVRESARTTDYGADVRTFQRKLGEMPSAKSAGGERIHISALLKQNSEPDA